MTTRSVLEFDRRPSALAYMVRGALPSNERRRDLGSDVVARWKRHRVDRVALESLETATGLPKGETLPILYPHVFGFRLAMAVLTHPTFPVPIWGVLQTRNHILERAPIARDATLDLETHVAASRVLEKGAEFDLHTAARPGPRRRAFRSRRVNRIDTDRITANPSIESSEKRGRIPRTGFWPRMKLAARISGSTFGMTRCSIEDTPV